MVAYGVASKGDFLSRNYEARQDHSYAISNFPLR